MRQLWRGSQALQQQLTAMNQRWNESKLAVSDVVLLVRLTGLEVYLAHELYFGNDTAWAWKVSKSATLADLLRWERKPQEYVGGKRFASLQRWSKCRLDRSRNPDEGKDIDETLGDFPTDPWIGHRGNPYGGYGYGFGGFGQFGFQGQFAQLGQFGNLAGQFGIGGFQGYQYRNNQGFGGGVMGIGGGALGINGLPRGQPSLVSMHS